MPDKLGSSGVKLISWSVQNLEKLEKNIFSWPTKKRPNFELSWIENFYFPAFFLQNFKNINGKTTTIYFFHYGLKPRFNGV